MSKLLSQIHFYNVSETLNYVQIIWRTPTFFNTGSETLEQHLLLFFYYFSGQFY